MAEKEETFGARLKRLREQAGLTQQQLADRTGMNRFGVAKLERDEYQPTWPVVQGVCRALGVSCAVFDNTVPPLPKGERPAKPMGRPRKHLEQPEQPGGLVEGLPGGEAGQGEAEKPKRKRKGK